MDPKIVKKTQDTLGKIIKKPPLTEKLLSKPPFRFLHDIITEVIRTTGFLKGLFTAEEMDSKNVTAKEAKIAFLQKVIDCVSVVSSENLAARPNKIIAGHEPEHTNELLQAIAHCIRRKMSSSEAVELVLSGKARKLSSKSKANAEKASSSTKQTENTADEREPSREKKSKHDLSSDKGKDKSSDPRRRSSKTRDKDESVDKDHDRERRRREKKSRTADDESSRRHDEPQEKESKRQSVLNQSEGDDDVKQSSSSSRGPRPASAKGQRRRPPPGSRSAKPDESSDNEAVSTPQTLARPPSARPGAPRIKQRNESAQDRIDSGGQHRTAPIIVDKGSDSAGSDDDAQFVVEEEQTPMNEVVSEPPISNGMHAGDSDEEHGGLVKKILETKKELEHSASRGMKQHTEIERSNVTTAQQKKERELVMKEIEQLRNSVQKLCQSVAPLAKIIDYIQEDMDAMQNELNFWKTENKQHAIRLQEEESVTQQSIEPLNRELQEIEQNISSYRNLMATTKANILRNDEKIRKMVVAVATRS